MTTICKERLVIETQLSRKDRSYIDSEYLDEKQDAPEKTQKLSADIIHSSDDRSSHCYLKDIVQNFSSGFKDKPINIVLDSNKVNYVENNGKSNDEHNSSIKCRKVEKCKLLQDSPNAKEIENRNEKSQKGKKLSDYVRDTNEKNLHSDVCPISKSCPPAVFKRELATKCGKDLKNQKTIFCCDTLVKSDRSLIAENHENDNGFDVYLSVSTEQLPPGKTNREVKNSKLDDWLQNSVVKHVVDACDMNNPKDVCNNLRSLLKQQNVTDHIDDDHFKEFLSNVLNSLNNVAKRDEASTMMSKQKEFIQLILGRKSKNTVLNDDSPVDIDQTKTDDSMDQTKAIIGTEHTKANLGIEQNKTIVSMDQTNAIVGTEETKAIGDTDQTKVIMGLDQSKAIAAMEQNTAIVGINQSKAIMDQTNAIIRMDQTKAIVGMDQTKAIVGMDQTKAIVGMDQTKAIVGMDQTKAIVGMDQTKAIVGMDQTKAMVGMDQTKAIVGMDQTIINGGMDQTKAIVGMDHTTAIVGMDQNKTIICINQNKKDGKDMENLRNSEKCDKSEAKIVQVVDDKAGRDIQNENTADPLKPEIPKPEILHGKLLVIDTKEPNTSKVNDDFSSGNHPMAVNGSVYQQLWPKQYKALKVWNEGIASGHITEEKWVHECNEKENITKREKSQRADKHKSSTHSFRDSRKSLAPYSTYNGSDKYRAQSIALNSCSKTGAQYPAYGNRHEKDAQNMTDYGYYSTEDGEKLNQTCSGWTTGGNVSQSAGMSGNVSQVAGISVNVSQIAGLSGHIETGPAVFSRHNGRQCSGQGQKNNQKKQQAGRQGQQGSRSGQNKPTKTGGWQGQGDLEEDGSDDDFQKEPNQAPRDGQKRNGRQPMDPSRDCKGTSSPKRRAASEGCDTTNRTATIHDPGGGGDSCITDRQSSGGKRKSSPGNMAATTEGSLIQPQRRGEFEGACDNTFLTDTEDPSSVAFHKKTVSTITPEGSKAPNRPPATLQMSTNGRVNKGSDNDIVGTPLSMDSGYQQSNFSRSNRSASIWTLGSSADSGIIPEECPSLADQSPESCQDHESISKESKMQPCESAALVYELNSTSGFDGVTKEMQQSDIKTRSENASLDTLSTVKEPDLLSSGVKWDSNVVEKSKAVVKDSDRDKFSVCDIQSQLASSSINTGTHVEDSEKSVSSDPSKIKIEGVKNESICNKPLVNKSEVLIPSNYVQNKFESVKYKPAGNPACKQPVISADSQPASNLPGISADSQPTGGGVSLHPSFVPRGPTLYSADQILSILLWKENDSFRKVIMEMCESLITICNLSVDINLKNHYQSIMIELLYHYAAVCRNRSTCEQCRCVYKIWEKHHSYNENSLLICQKQLIPNAHTRCPLKICQKRGKGKQSRMLRLERRGYSLNAASVSLTSAEFHVETNESRLKSFFVDILYERQRITVERRNSLKTCLLTNDPVKDKTQISQQTVNSQRAPTLAGIYRSHTPTSYQSLDLNSQQTLVKSASKTKSVLRHSSERRSGKTVSFKDDTLDGPRNSADGFYYARSLETDVESDGFPQDSPSTSLSLSNNFSLADVVMEQLQSPDLSESQHQDPFTVVYGDPFDLNSKAGSWEELCELYNVDGILPVRNRYAEGVILNCYSQDLVIDPVCNRYEDGEQWDQVTFLGSGVSGKCYLAKDRTSKKKFCVKVIDLLNFDASEILVWSGLNHDNIVKLLGALRIHEKIYLLSEFIDGGTLKDFVDRQNISSPGRGIHVWYVLKFTQDILQALVHMKLAGIVHEDLKADNIMIHWESTPRCVVIDFGLSRELEPDMPFIESEAPLGGQTHLSPEKAKSEKYDYKSDVWAAFCDVLHMINGIEPWRNKFGNFQTLILVIADNSPPEDDIPDCNDRPEITPDIVDLIRQGLTVDPERRPHAEELLKHPAFKNIDDRLANLPHTRDHNRNPSAPPRNTENTIPSIIESFREESMLHSDNDQNRNPVKYKSGPANDIEGNLVDIPNVALGSDMNANVAPSLLNSSNYVAPKGPPGENYIPNFKPSANNVPSLVGNLSENDVEMELENSSYLKYGENAENSSDFDMRSFSDLSQNLDRLQSSMGQFTQHGQTNNNYDDFNIPALSDFGNESTVYDDARSETLERGTSLPGEHESARVELGTRLPGEQVEPGNSELQYNHDASQNSATNDYKNPNNRRIQIRSSDTTGDSPGHIVYQRRNDAENTSHQPQHNTHQTPPNQATNRCNLQLDFSEGASALDYNHHPVVGLPYGMRDGIFWSRNEQRAPSKMSRSKTAPVDFSQEPPFSMPRSLSSTPYSYDHPPSQIPQTPRTPSRGRVAPNTLDWGHNYAENSQGQYYFPDLVQMQQNQGDMVQNPPRTSTPERPAHEPTSLSRAHEPTSLSSQHSFHTPKSTSGSLDNSQSQNKVEEQWKRRKRGNELQASLGSDVSEGHHSHGTRNNSNDYSRELELRRREIEEKAQMQLFHSLSSCGNNPAQTLKQLHESMSGSYLTAEDHISHSHPLNRDLSREEVSDVMQSLSSTSTGARGVKVEFCSSEYKVLVSVRVTDLHTDTWKSVVETVAFPIHRENYPLFTVTDGNQPLDLTAHIPESGLIQVTVEMLHDRQLYQWRVRDGQIQYSEQFRGPFMHIF